MPTRLEKIIGYLCCGFIFLLPWATAYIWREGVLGGFKWEYGTMVVYGTEILLWTVFILWFILFVRERKFSIFNFQFSIKDKKWLTLVSLVWFLVLWSGLSILWSGDKWLAFYWWFHLLEGAALFFVILNLKFHWLKIFWALVLAGAVQSVLALWQFWSQSSAANAWLGLAQHWPADLGTSVVAYGGLRWLRAYGAFGHPNVLGGFLAVCFLAALFLYFRYPAGWQKILSVVSLLLISAGVFFSFSRSAWLALAAGYVLVIILIWSSRAERGGVEKSPDQNKEGIPCLAGRRAPRGLFRAQVEGVGATIKVTFYLVIIFACLFVIYRPLVITRLAPSERLEIKSAEERLGSLVEAEAVIKNNWLWGTGIGNYTHYLSQKNPGQPAFAYQPAHNLYLLVFSELGLVGILTFLFFGFLIFLSRFRRPGIDWLGLAVLAILLVIGLFDHYLWTTYIGIMLWWLALGLGLKRKSPASLTADCPAPANHPLERQAR